MDEEKKINMGNRGKPLWNWGRKPKDAIFLGAEDSDHDLIDVYYLPEEDSYVGICGNVFNLSNDIRDYWEGLRRRKKGRRKLL